MADFVLNREAILNAKDLSIERVKVPEWGGDVCVKTITAGERGKIEADLAAYRESKQKSEWVIRMFNMRLAALAICDESGRRLFSDEDMAVLAEKSARVISRIALVAQRLAGLSKADMEALEKN